MRKTVLKRALGASVIRLVKPTKESAFRWGAESEGQIAHGDTPEEACDNLKDLLAGLKPAKPLPARGRRS